MQNLLFDELCIKRKKQQFLIFAIACVAALSIVYMPIYLLLYSNVLWRNSILLFLMSEFIKPLIDFSFYWGSFAFLIYMHLRFGKKEIRYFAIICSVAVVARYLFSTLAGYLIMSFPTGQVFWLEEVPSMLVGSIMDLLQMLGALLLAEFCCRRPMLNTKAYSKGKEGQEMLADCFPIEGLFNFKNQLAKVCLLAAAIPAGVMMLTRLYYDIYSIITFGFPTELAEWLLIATYYIGDVASCLIGYFVLLYLLQTFYTKEMQRRTDFES